MVAEQAALLVNNKIYVYGGVNERTKLSDFFYLDISSSFIINNITSMPWVNITPSTGLSVRTSSAACIYGKNKNQIVYIGGDAIVGDNFTTVYDITTQQWSIPKTSASFTSNRKLIQCVVSEDDIYVYGGLENVYDMIKLDTLNLSWTEFSPGPVAPIGVQSYRAILLNNASILYIGGQPGSDVPTLPYSSFDKLSMYNINNSTWSLITTSGNIPPSRYDHGAVYIPLDTVKFEWSIPTIKNVGGPTDGLRRFISILIETYVFIAFGSFDINGQNCTNNFFLLDVSQKNNYEWATLYDPTKQFKQPPPTINTTSVTPTISPYNNATPNIYTNNIGAIIGVGFAAIAGIIVLSTAAVLVVKRYGYPLPHFAPREKSSNDPNNEVFLD
ncbi:9924_t:CDS:2 [Gigaspora margarita]|uniref:9924_t:CDS:1 n=1 Tax=Gigaspora margarita TaxID=4874 RepID=A0ABN7UXH2_GIGMA|nr:9924_t:CDS:2 [Gigaspora margarita]